MKGAAISEDTCSGCKHWKPCHKGADMGFCKEPKNKDLEARKINGEPCTSENDTCDHFAPVATSK